MNESDKFENEEVRFTMRMDAYVYERLKESAIKNKRSIAKELEYITEQHFVMHENGTQDKFNHFLDLLLEWERRGKP